MQALVRVKLGYFQNKQIKTVFRTREAFGFLTLFLLARRCTDVKLSSKPVFFTSF